MTNYSYLALAYLAFWLIPFAICLLTWNKTKQLEKRLEALDQKK